MENLWPPRLRWKTLVCRLILNRWLMLRDRWDGLKDGLITKMDRGYGVFGGGQTFKEARFEEYVTQRSIPWPRLSSGKLEMKDEIFKAMAMTYPQVEPLRQLRQTLSKMILTNITVGPDGRTAAS